MEWIAEKHDWNKCPVKYIARTEQRLAFQEVTLIPKIVDFQAKGKGGANGMSESIRSHYGDIETITSGLLPNPGDQAARIDMLTGVTAPVLTRAPRQKKETTTTASTRSRKKDATKSTKAKGERKGSLAYRWIKTLTTKLMIFTTPAEL